MRQAGTVLGRALLPGLVAGSLSALVLAWRGRLDNAAAAAPINAPSQWVWGRTALVRNRPSVRFTATGFAVHQLASLFWGAVHAKTAPAILRRSLAPAAALRHAAAVTALAACVDLRIVPERLTPGFQRRLSTRSLCWVYAAFGVGLALGQMLQEAASLSAGHGKATRADSGDRSRDQSAAAAAPTASVPGARDRR